jgi:hypothetical protein
MVMKTRVLALAVALTLLFSACIPSVHPFYTEKDVVFNAGLLGEWLANEDADEPETWTFASGADKGYELIVREKNGKQGKFAARLFKLGNAQFLDLIPTECELAPDQADLVGAALFPGHLLMRVPQIGSELQLAYCDYDWLEKFLTANPKALAHRKQDDATLLTARTRELQRFVRKHMGEMFQEPKTMVKKRN